MWSTTKLFPYTCATLTFRNRNSPAAHGVLGYDAHQVLAPLLDALANASTPSTLLLPPDLFSLMSAPRSLACKLFFSASMTTVRTNFDPYQS
jgi:hypothetical protein